MNRSLRTVSDTGPLISLEKLENGYHFIGQLYDKIIVPPAVLGEVTEGIFDHPEAYLAHYGIQDLIEVQNISLMRRLSSHERLHEAEIQAINLALELGLPLLIEETQGRRVAQEMGVHISGIAGQIIKAYQADMLADTEAFNMLNMLLQNGRINRKIFESLISILGET